MPTNIPDNNWYTSDDGITARTVEHAQLAVLMDIRRELKTLNALLHCHNFTDMPRVLRQVRANTAKPKPKKPRTPKAS